MVSLLPAVLSILFFRQPESPFFLYFFFFLPFLFFFSKIFLFTLKEKRAFAQAGEKGKGERESLSRLAKHVAPTRLDLMTLRL